MAHRPNDEHDNVIDLKNQLNRLRNSYINTNVGGVSTNNVSYGMNSKSASIPNLVGSWAITPIDHNVGYFNTTTNLFINNVADSGGYFHINLLSTSVIVVGTPSPLILSYIDGPKSNGQIVLIKPQVGNSLTLKAAGATDQSQGNLNLDSDITLDDHHIAILQFFNDIGTGGGKYIVLSSIGGGGGSFLPIAGGSMNGPIAYGPKVKNTSTSGGKGHLNIGTSGAYSSNVLVNASPSSNQLSYIDGDAFDGQILIIQILPSETLTFESNGNIWTSTLNTQTVNGPASVPFIFNSTVVGPDGSSGQSWIEMSSGGGGGSFLPLAGGTMSGTINMGNENITNLAKEEFTSGTTVTAGQFGISVPVSFLTFNVVNPSTDAFSWTFANTEKFHMSSSAIYPTVNHVGDLGISSTNEFGNLFVQGVSISGFMGFVGTIGNTGWLTDCYPHIDGGANLGHISGTVARWANCYLAGSFFNYEVGSSNKYFQIVKNTSDHYVYYNCNDTVTGVGHAFQKNGTGYLATLEDDGLFWGMVEHQSVTTLTTGSYSLGNQYGVIFCDCSGGTVTLTLPAMAGFNGRTYRFIKTDASGNSVIVNRSSTDTINGATSLSWNTQYQAKDLIANGSGLWGVF